MQASMNIGDVVTGVTPQSDDDTLEKYCYDNNTNNCITDGALYQFDEAMQYGTFTPGAQGICPDGWHLPTDVEQDTLDQYLTDSGQTCDPNRLDLGCYSAGTKLRNLSNFNALLSGINGAGTFSLRASYAFFWSSSIGGPNAWYRFLQPGYMYNEMIGRNSTARTSGLSVRCLQD
jgi:uncharacterized protein (TIGR02145 family)